MEEKNENLQFELDKQENHVAKIALERKHIAKDKIKSVSYTHLDVYKRQLFQFGF